MIYFILALCGCICLGFLINFLYKRSSKDPNFRVSEVIECEVIGATRYTVVGKAETYYELQPDDPTKDVWKIRRNLAYCFKRVHKHPYHITFAKLITICHGGFKK